MGTRTASRRAHEATTSVDHASRTSGRPAASLRPPVSGVGLLDHAEAATGPIRLERAGAGSAGIVQAKSASSMRLTAGGHASEREADRVAERVVRGGDGGAPLAITRRPSAGDGVAIAPRVERGIVQARGDGVPLSPHHRRGVEETLDADLGQVRVHADARADRLSRSLGARAFTTGHDIFFRRGAFDPGSAAGARLLAHELTHVVQQDGAAGQVQRVGDGQGPAATEEHVAEQAEVAHAPQAHAEPQESGAGVGAAEPAVPEQAPPEQAPPELEVPELEVPEQAPPELAASEYRLESDPTIADLAPKAQEKVAAQNSAAAKPAPDLLGCTLKESLDHAGKAVVATQLDALYLEKTESAIVEDNHIVHAVRATLGVAPWDTLKPALDAKIQALQDKGDATTAEKEQLFELEQGRELLLSFGTPEKLQTAEAASDWRVEALKLWTTGVRMNQFVVERLYRHIERLHERMHLGAVHLPLPAEARARKTDAREEAADLATEAVLRKRHSRRYRDRAKIWKVDLIHKNRIAPTYSEAFGKALKFNAVVAYYEQNTSSDSSQQTEAWLASKSLSLGGKLARSLVVKETPKNKSKAYKLYRDLRKGKIEGPLMTRIGETDEAHRVFEEILASKRYDVGAAADAASVELGSLGSQVETVDAQSDAVIHSLDANREDPSVVERHGRTQSMFEGFRTIRGSLGDIGGLPALIREHIR